MNWTVKCFIGAIVSGNCPRIPVVLPEMCSFSRLTLSRHHSNPWTQPTQYQKTSWNPNPEQRCWTSMRPWSITNLFLSCLDSLKAPCCLSFVWRRQRQPMVTEQRHPGLSQPTCLALFDKIEHLKYENPVIKNIVLSLKCSWKIER